MPSNNVAKWIEPPSSALAGLNAPAPVDPYLLWAESTRYAVCGGAPDVIPVMFERCAPPSAQDDDGLGAWIRQLHDSNPLNGRSSFGTAQLPRSALPRLTQAVASGWLNRFELALPRIAAEPFAATSTASPPSPDTGDGGMPGLRTGEPCTVLGVVDDGCCLAHEHLRPGNRTRFACVWDQSRDLSPQSRWRASSDTPYGGEMSWREIDALLAQHPALGEIDERKFYAALGRPQWGGEGRRHGAGVLHVLAQSRSRSSAPLRPIVFVQMPGTTVADTSGGSLGLHVVDGARYIVRRARELAQTSGCPRWSATINLSLGSLSGPHDGSTITEMALAEIASEDGVGVVIAAGNGATWKTHAHKAVSRDHPARFSVLASPDNPRETYVEIWFPPLTASDAGVLDGLTVDVASPAGARSGPVAVGEASTLRTGDDVVASVVFARHVAQGTRGTMALIALRATGDDAGGAAAPYGVWTIDVCSAVPTSIDVHGWIQRNDVIVGPRLGQQACFVDDITGYVSTSMTLGSIANGPRTTVVGGYRVQDASIVDYSGQGPTRESPGRQGPDFYAPSDQSAFLPGVEVPGFFSGSRVRVSGTSIAAPRVARWLADGMPGDEAASIAEVASESERALAAPILRP